MIRAERNKLVLTFRILTVILSLSFIQHNDLNARVPDDSLNVKVYYPCGSSDLSGFPANALRLDRYIQQLDSVCSLPFVSPGRLTVTSSSSPEGSIGRNRQLSHARAQSVVDYLSMRSEKFRNFANSLDFCIDERTTNSKRGRTRLSQYPSLRFSEVTLHFKLQERDTLADVPSPVADVLSPVAEADSVTQRDTAVALPKETCVTDSLLPTRHPEFRTEESRPILFVKSNLAYDLLSFINAAVEIPLGKNVSVEAAYVNPWWHSMRRHRTIQLRYLSVTPRYYFGRADYTSFFTGLSAGWGKYDLQLTRHGVQGELWHVSPVFGYVHQLARNWKMEYSVSVGYVQTEYRKYTQVSETPYGEIKVHDYPWVTHSFRSVLPTSVGVSLIYTLHRVKAQPHSYED